MPLIKISTTTLAFVGNGVIDGGNTPNTILFCRDLLRQFMDLFPDGKLTGRLFIVGRLALICSVQTNSDAPSDLARETKGKLPTKGAWL